MECSHRNDFIKTSLYQILREHKNKELKTEVRKLFMQDVVTGKMYKYRSFNKYSLKNLKQGTLYCATPSSLNDPFDCKIGIDVMSLMMAKYGIGTEFGEKYFMKFMQINNGVITLESCTEDEQSVISYWLEDERICSFIEGCKRADLDEQKGMEIVLNNLDVIIDMLLVLIKDEESRMQIKNVCKIIMELVNTWSYEQKKAILYDDTTLEDFLKILGTKKEGDQISLLSQVSQRIFPEQAEQAIKLDDSFNDLANSIQMKIDELYCVGSLCTDYKNSLMWSHYSDGHKGFCIEYDFGTLDVSEDILILPVIYSKNRIKLPWSIAFINNEDEKNKKEAELEMIQSLLTKDEIWSYEKEWRVILLNQRKNRNIKMPPISCIYIGALCKEKDKKRLIKIATKHNISVKQMMVDRGEYKLYAQECN